MKVLPYSLISLPALSLIACGNVNKRLPPISEAIALHRTHVYTVSLEAILILCLIRWIYLYSGFQVYEVHPRNRVSWLIYRQKSVLFKKPGFSVPHLPGKCCNVPRILSDKLTKTTDARLVCAVKNISATVLPTKLFCLIL